MNDHGRLCFDLAAVAGMRRPLAAAGFAVALVINPGFSTSAIAHPHVWIDAQATFVFVDGAVSAVDIEWLFDDMISVILVEDFDLDRSGSFDDGEIAALRSESFDGLADFNYFVNMRIDGQARETHAAENFSADIRGDRVAYSFRVVLPDPVDPLTTPITIGLYDETFFVEVTVPEETILLAGTRMPDCNPRIFADSDNPIYFGYVDPPMIDLGCR